MWRPVLLGCGLALILFAAVVATVAGVYVWQPAHRKLPLSPPTPAEIKFLQQKALRVNANIKKTCDDLHLVFGGPAEGAPAFSRADDNPAFDSLSYTGPCADFDSDHFRFSFRREDWKLDSYQDSYLIDDLPAAKQYYDAPVKPQWTTDQAIAIADVFRRVMQDPSPAILGKPSANYYSNAEFVDDGPRKNVKKFRLGEWDITWPRVDSRGRPFYNDHVTIQIQEGYGPLGAGIMVTTPYIEETGVPISEMNALAKARAILSWRLLGQKVFYNLVLSDEFERNVTGATVLSKDLVVVIPRKGRFAYSPDSTTPPTARLAWIFWFKPTHGTPPTGAVWDDSIAIWIDAYTGEEIGGDAML
jgi:hypothetical protein